MTSGLYNIIRSNLLQLLENEAIEPKDLENQIDLLISSFQIYYPDQIVNKEDLFRDIMSAHKIWVGDSSIMEDNRDHQEWLDDQISEIEWNYWKRYHEYLKSGEKLPFKVIQNIDEMSSEILRRLEDPKRPGAWDRRGMVVGNVQSGKTSNYIGLICKAVDAGYKVIIVLAGTNNDLRSQTQKRIDKGFLGKDTSKRENYDQGSSKIGAGRLIGFNVPPVHAVTSSDSGGDYKNKVHNTITITPGGDPIIAIVKKNVTPLKNLFKWFDSVNDSGKIDNVPLLLIDDEADNASINTKALKKIGMTFNEEEDEEVNPTKINGYIRKILNSFVKSAYLGYTATPFANIFIYPDDPYKNKTEYGEDLYPRSFIVNLHAPSNYLGPEKVFGLYGDHISGIEAQDGLPLVNKITDYVDFFPDKHKSSLLVTDLPDSLIRSIHSFILSCAARVARGQGDKHNSMLIHVTRFVNVQSQIYDLVKNNMKKITEQLEIRTGPQYDKLINQLKIIWDEEYISVSNIVRGRVDDQYLTNVSWEQIESNLYKCSSKIKIKEINGQVADGGLEYELHPKGLYVIAIGGDKLSRGLTLEGLTISYYTRATRMYDTLLQMGRWFGYRSGYVDLCRLYTSPQLANWYQHIAVANEELRQELDYMASINATPENYGLRVRTHPDGMIITALNKMKNSQDCEVTFEGKLIQTTRFYRESKINDMNYKHTEKWLQSFGSVHQLPEKENNNNYVWKNISSDKIIEFLDGFTVHQTCVNANPRMLKEYIISQNNRGELINWTIALISSSQTVEKLTYANCDIGVPWRTEDESDPSDNTIFLKRSNLITPSDQDIDLTEEQKQKAYEDTLRHARHSSEQPKKASPLDIRYNRNPENGLLLIYVFHTGEKRENRYACQYIGFAFSFPGSNTARPIKYKVDEIYRRFNYDDDIE